MSRGTKYGRFVTIDDRVVFMGGPSSGAGGASAVTALVGAVPAVYDESKESLRNDGQDYLDRAETFASSYLIRAVVGEIEEQTGLGVEVANVMIREWAGSSNSSQTSREMQEEAARLFGTGLSEWQKEKFGSWGEEGIEPPLPPKAVSRVLQAMYENTQKQLIEEGVPDTVTLRRGIRGTPPGDRGEVVSVYENALTSFTSSEAMAHEFMPALGSGYVIEIQVPRSRILSTARTGLGAMAESEFVVLGNNSGQGDQVKIVEIK